LPAVEAFKVVIPEVPPILSTPVTPFVNPPAPESAVPIVRVPLLVHVPETVTLGIEVALTPLNVLPAPFRVCVPLLAVNVVPSF